MDSCNTTFRDILSCNSQGKSGNFTPSLRLCDGKPLVSANCNLGHSSGALSSTGEERAISILAEFLAAPFGRNANELAENLIGRHGSLSRVLNAKERTEGCPENAAYAIINAAFRFVEAMLLENISGTVVDPSDPALLKFLKLKFHKTESEQMQSIFLDGDMKFISHEVLAIGDESKLMLDSSYLFRRCIELGASTLILAHNHPSGSAVPSQADRESTMQLQKMAQFLGIKLADHIIFGAHQAFSMRKGCML